MNKNNIDQLILRMESYLECWKQFNNFLGMARSKKFTQDDENQFMEIKSVITQELELILSVIDSNAVNRDEVHNLMAGCPSIRFLGEMNDAGIRSVEANWHKLFISWQAILGQLKVRQQQIEAKSLVGTLFGRRKAA